VPPTIRRWSFAGVRARAIRWKRHRSRRLTPRPPLSRPQAQRQHLAWFTGPRVTCLGIAVLPQNWTVRPFTTGPLAQNWGTTTGAAPSHWDWRHPLMGAPRPRRTLF